MESSPSALKVSLRAAVAPPSFTSASPHRVSPAVEELPLLASVSPVALMTSRRAVTASPFAGRRKNRPLSFQL